MKRKLIDLGKRDGGYHVFVEPKPVEHEPECVGEGDVGAFDKFLLPRIKNTRDEASREILEYMRAGRSLYDAVADALRSLPSAKTRKLRTWLDEARSTRIYASVRYLINPGTPEPLYARVGLQKTVGGPKDKLLEWRELDQISTKDVGRSWIFREAIVQIKNVAWAAPYYDLLQRVRWVFEKMPAVLVSSEAEYNEVLHWTKLSDSKWKGGGLYNFNHMPPTFIGTVDDYRNEAMTTNAPLLIDDMLKRGAWKKACGLML